MIIKNKLTYNTILAANKGDEAAINAIMGNFEPLVEIMSLCVLEIKRNAQMDSVNEIRGYIKQALIQSIFNINMSELLEEIQQ